MAAVKKIIHLAEDIFIIMLVLSFAFVFIDFPDLQNFSGRITEEGSLEKSLEKESVGSLREVYTCHNRTTKGAGLFKVMEKKARMTLSYISDFCVDDVILRKFACVIRDGKHYLASADVDCASREMECSRGRCEMPNFYLR